MKIEKHLFGILPTGEEIYIFRASSSDDCYFEVSNFGATWLSACVPDSQGNYADVLLGYKTLEGYIQDKAYIGASVGRFANRIADAKFSIGEETFHLEKNDGENCNHSGTAGFHKKVFDFEMGKNEVVFSLFSPDGEGGFGGNLSVKIHYIFEENLTLTIRYEAVSDKVTWVNLTNHAYFNLRGKGKIGEHFLQIDAEKVLQTNDTFIPTGKILNVENSVFDFRKSKRISDLLSSNDAQVLANRGLNHCYIFPENKNGELQKNAELYEETSGRLLQVKSTYPAVLFYSAGYLSSDLAGKNGEKYAVADGFCIETQFPPDAPNLPDFQHYLLQAGAKYEHETQYSFKLKTKN